MNRKRRVLMSERQYRQFRRFLSESTSGGVLKLGTRKVIHYESGMNISTSGVIFNFKEMKKVHKTRKLGNFTPFEQFSITFEVSFFSKRGSIDSSYNGEIIYEVPKNEGANGKAKYIYDFDKIDFLELYIEDFEEEDKLYSLILQNLKNSKSSKSGRYVSKLYGRAVSESNYAHEIYNVFLELSNEVLRRGLSGYYYGGDYRTL